MKTMSEELEKDQQANIVTPPTSLRAAPAKAKPDMNHFSRPPEFLGNRFVYAVISQRAHGLSIGINFNPDKYCNFDCPYCDVNRSVPPRDTRVDLDILSAELESLLSKAYDCRLREYPYFQNVPQELLALKGVALSGEGEPTLSPQFVEIIREVIHIRSRGKFPFFKLVLITNGTGLDRGEIQEGLQSLTSRDEIWIKLEAGTQEYMNAVNRTPLSLQKLMANILRVGRERSIVIQSLFPLLNGLEPAPEEIEAYVNNLKCLKQDGAQISLVQIYSAMRPPHHPKCGHLPLKSLSRIAHRVREVTGLHVEVF